MANEKHEHAFHFTVDGEELTTAEHTLTVRQILQLANLDPDTHYLIELKGEHQDPLKDLDQPVHMHEHQKFISVFTGETPVS